VFGIRCDGVELVRYPGVLAQIEYIRRFHHRSERNLLLDHKGTVVILLDGLLADGKLRRDWRDGGIVGEAGNLIDSGVVDGAVEGVRRIPGRELGKVAVGKVDELPESGAQRGLPIAEDVPGQTNAGRGYQRRVRVHLQRELRTAAG